TRFSRDWSSDVCSSDLGPVSTKAPPEGVGEFHKQISVNPYSENQLSELAGWRVYLGTADEARYPELEVKRGTPAIYSDPDLVGQLNSVDFGDIVGVDNLPEWISPEEIGRASCRERV